MKKIYSSRPVVSEHTLNAAFKKYNGKNFVCTTASGSPAILNIYNMDEDKIEASFELDGSLNCWNHIIGPDGRLYADTYGKLYRYDFSSGEFKKLGVICEGEGECFAVDSDGKENLYFGSCPGGKIIRFNIYEEKFYDYGCIAEGISYIRSLSYLNGYLYCGVKGDSVLGFYKIEANNPENKKEIPVPSNAEYYPDGLKWIYTSRAVGDKIIIHTKANGISPLLIYDTVKEEFVDTGFRGNFPGLYSSPERNGKSYFISEGKLMEADIKSGKIDESDFPLIDCLGSPSVDFITDTVSGRELMAILDNRDASVLLLDIEGKTFERKKLMLETGRYYIQSVEAGDFKNGDTGIYISGYCGDRAVRYDTLSGELRTIMLEQAEGMIGYNGVQYFGIYPGNRLYSYNHKCDNEKPVFLGKMSSDQDRPFAMCAGDGKIFMGTVPDYGLRGGDIISYDISTAGEKVFCKPMGEQSIIGLSWYKGKLYGSTSVWGGLSAIPDASPAKIFIFDPESGKTVKAVVPEIPGITHPTWIGGIVAVDEDTVWAVTGNTLFKYDFEKEKTLAHISFGEYTYSNVKHRWRPTYIRFDSKGNLYTNINGIQLVNPDTLEHKRITEEEEVFLFTLDGKSRICYAIDSNFYILDNTEEEE